jgi:hypothetical protein
MAAGISAFRRSVFTLIIVACFAGVSCADRESPTSPAASSNAGKTTISGTLLAATDAPAGGASGAAQPLAGVAVRVASTGQTAQTDAAGNFTLAGVSPGAVGLDLRGAGIQASVTVNASAGMTTRVTVTVNRGRGTVSLTSRSDGIEGIVDSINLAGNSFVVKNPRGMVTVQTDAGTLFRMRGSLVGLGDLKVGQKVEAEGSPQPDGSLLARKVNIQNRDEEEETRTPTPSPTATTTPPTATPTSTVTTTPATATPTRTPRPQEVELEGTVGAISGTSFVLMTRTGPVTIQTNSATVFRKEDGPATFADIKTGGKVEVEGTRQNDGSVLASRVNIEGGDDQERTKTPTGIATTTTTATTPQPTRTPTPTRTPELEGAGLEGTVGNINGSSFVLMTRSGPVTIQTNSATQFRNDDNPATFADIKTGSEVEVEGTSQPDGSVLASRISLKGK